MTINKAHAKRDDLPRGLCPTCQEGVRLRGDGRLWGHPNLLVNRCPGSGELPAGATDWRARALAAELVVSRVQDLPTYSTRRGPAVLVADLTAVLASLGLVWDEEGDRVAR